MKYQMCKRCVMDNASDKNIKFDNEGNCEYCNEALKRKPNYKKDDFQNLIKMLKEEGKNKEYDCVLGISGGIDSSYLAYLLTKNGVRVKGVHIDAGWNTPISEENVKMLCEKCNIDLEVIKIDREEMYSLQKAYLESGVMNQDVPQDHIFFAELFKYMMKHHYKYFISGHNWSSESITPIRWGYDSYDSTNLKDIYYQYTGKHLKKYKTMSFFTYRIKVPYFYKIKKLRPLNMMDYNPNEALEILKKEIGYKEYGPKHCESVYTRLLQCYIQPKMYGYEKRQAHLSSMIISGCITKKEALKILKEKPCSKELIEDDIKYVIEKLQMTRKEFDNIINAKNIHQHTEFKNEIKKGERFDKIKKIIKK